MEQGSAGGIGYLAGYWPPDPTKSTLFFIHGAGGSSLFWQAQVEGLAQRVNTIALDLPGHGRSSGSGYDTIAAYSRSVFDFIEALDVMRPVVCGISMGGAICQQMLLDAPDQLKGGILINTGARLRAAPVIFDAIDNDYAGYLSLIGQLVGSETTAPEDLKRFQEETARCKPEVTRRDFLACDGFDVMQRLGSITLPVLVVSAENDKLTPPKYGEFLGKNIAGATRVTVPQAGHIMPMEKPDELNRAIIDFLDHSNL